MIARLLILLFVAALVEAAVLVWLIKGVGLLSTIATLILAGVIGAALARWQGLRAWQAIRSDLAAGRPPGAAVIDGVMVLCAGVLLLLPGLLSDVCAILLLVPQVRTALRVPLTTFLARRISLRFRAMASRSGGFGQGEVIDAEFRRADAPLIENRPPLQ